MAGDADTHAQAVDLPGVQEVVVVPSPHEHFEAHVAQRALEALIEQREPAVVLAGHTIDSLGFAPAVAARGLHGFASDITAVSWSEQGVLAERAAYGEQPDRRARLSRKADRPALAARRRDRAGGAIGRARGASGEAGSRWRLRVDRPCGARSPGRGAQRALGAARPPAGEVDITKADFLLSLGRGIEHAERIPRLERLAERMGATVSVSGPLVEAGWASPARKVGQSGKTVAPRVYLALGISGAAQHIAGISGARTIIAVNSDPNARIFDVAHYGAVADLFEVADELERQLG